MFILESQDYVGKMRTLVSIKDSMFILDTSDLVAEQYSIRDIISISEKVDISNIALNGNSWRYKPVDLKTIGEIGIVVETRGYYKNRVVFRGIPIIEFDADKTDTISFYDVSRNYLLNCIKLNRSIQASELNPIIPFITAVNNLIVIHLMFKFGTVACYLARDLAGAGKEGCVRDFQIVRMNEVYKLL